MDGDQNKSAGYKIQDSDPNTNFDAHVCTAGYITKVRSASIQAMVNEDPDLEQIKIMMRLNLQSYFKQNCNRMVLSYDKAQIRMGVRGEMQ